MTSPPAPVGLFDQLAAAQAGPLHLDSDGRGHG